jgi:lambda family phage tail tape measure protein
MREVYEADRTFIGALKKSAQEQAASMLTVGEAFVDALTGIQDTLSSSLEQFITAGTFRLKDFAVSVHKVLSKIVADYISTMAAIGMKKAIFAIANVIVGNAVSGSGLTAPNNSAIVTPDAGGASLGVHAALGKIFDSGNVMAFAGGGTFTNGIVNGATQFPIGVMGEAGPEAIMPLARDSSGRLGVRASGTSISNNSITITVNVSNETEGDQSNGPDKQETMMKSLSETLRGVVLKTVAEEMRKGGALNQYRQ